MVAEQLALIRDRIATASGRSGRDPDDVTVVVISKARSVAEIESAYAAGHRDFGENRSDELAEKAAELPEDIRWHFVGTLQRRRIAQVRSLTVLLHSMDREALARRWNGPDGKAPPSLLQINIGGEEQKHGVPKHKAYQALADMAQVGVHPVGLMVIPPAPGHPEDSRAHFAELAELGAALRSEYPDLVELSMGMTDDFEVAVEEGATLVRLGRAIFGPRSG